TAKAVYPSKWSLPGGGKDACVGVTVHTYDPYDFCGENGHSNYYANPKAMKKDLIFKFKDLRDWAFDTDIPVYVGEYGVGRQMDRQWDRNNENVREYYKFVFLDCKLSRLELQDVNAIEFSVHADWDCSGTGRCGEWVFGT
ncbi:celCCD, partial [Symbiodinium sp. CCMP2456]